MNAPGEHRFDWGHAVMAAVDLVNDGSHPGSAEGALLAAVGACGTVVQTGLVEATRTPVYMVEFADGTVVGCFDAELTPVPGAGFVPG